MRALDGTIMGMLHTCLSHCECSQDEGKREARTRKEGCDAQLDYPDVDDDLDKRNARLSGSRSMEHLHQFKHSLGNRGDDRKQTRQYHIRQLAKVYDKISVQYNNKWKDFYLHQELAKFVSYLPKAAKVLDAGCGHGRDAVYFAKLGLDVTAIDISRKMLVLACEKARRSGLTIRFYRKDMSKLSRMDLGSFDGIWCCGSFVHVPPELHQRTINGFHSLLDESGILWLSSRNLRLPTESELVIRWASKGFRSQHNKYGEYVFDDCRYMVAVTSSYLSHMLQRAGFSVLGVTRNDGWINILSQKRSK